MRAPRLRAAVAALVVFGLLPAAAQARTAPRYYVSLGDSYAQGVQPIGPGQADIATHQGYTDVLLRRARGVLPGLKLARLGCGGATTDSIITGSKPCGEKLPYRSTSRATSQLTYATKFMRAHRGQIALVTISIGGNDVAPCASAGDLNAIVQCVTTGMASIKRNLPVIARDLRRAAGPKAVILGSTYPDVVLGQWVKGSSGQQLATASVPIFRDQLNPLLKKTYAKRHIGFVDATNAFGAYIPFDETSDLAPFGQVPKAVANICTLAWYCADRPQGPDIHLRPAGYRKLAGLYFASARKKLRALRPSSARR
jgi:lysophospholipase L1-like esterase